RRPCRRKASHHEYKTGYYNPISHFTPNTAPGTCCPLGSPPRASLRIHCPPSEGIMTRPVQLPSEAEVRIAIEELRSATQNNTITVKQLAQQLGLTNPTFWRHFPDIAQEVADIRRAVRRTI